MSTEIFDKLQEGIKLQQDNDLLGAEAAYREILDQHPDHPDALHLLGVLAYQIGDYKTAEELISLAINSEHVIADYYNNMGEVMRASGREDDARSLYQKALDLDPEHGNAKNNLQKLSS